MIQLRIRSEYTFRQTFAPMNKIIARLQSIGCTAAGLVDIDSTWGHVPWFKACHQAGIKPLLGVDLVVTDDDRSLRMWFLARNKNGLSELYRATTQAHQQQLATKVGHLPRLYTSDVIGMSDNIIRFAGDRTDGMFLAEVNAFLDLNPSSRIVNAAKSRAAAEYDLPIVATSDNWYADEKDRLMLEFIPRGREKQTPQHILADLEYQEAAEIIAGNCDVQLPRAAMVAVTGDLEQLCRDGIEYRNMNWTGEYESRLQYELKLIRSKNYESYFVIVADMTVYAKSRMLVGPSRGSAAGSLVCYASRITEIDPLPNGLFFERFIDVSRVDLPDIDLDFPDDKRQMVFDYMSEKYGAGNVAHIGTVNRFKPRSALIQVCKALRIAPSATYKIKMAMVDDGLESTMNNTEAGRAFVQLYPQAMVAAKLEGHISHSGVHAAGLLIGTDRIDGFCAVDTSGIAHLDKSSAERLGLLKIDVLGLRTLSVLADADIDIDWYRLPLTDQKTFDVFNSRQWCSIFQFEGAALRRLSESIQFNSIAEIDAATALARPGPLASGVAEKYVARHNGETYTPIHPRIEAIMSDTYGLPVYQEHTLAIVREIGQFDWSEVGDVRKAISKTGGIEYLKRFHNKFLRGATAQGIPETAADEIWELITKMGAWQMNKAHTFSYAVISYWTAWLKAHHPLQFALANLNHAKSEDSAIELLREMTRSGAIEFIPFDLERSAINWSIYNGKLLGGFTALQDIGEARAQELVTARDTKTLSPAQYRQITSARNPFKNIFPFEVGFSNYYDNPKSHGIAGSVHRINELTNGMPHRQEYVFLGEMVRKNLRSANEATLIKERNGRSELEHLEFLDLRLRDDTGTIGARVSRWDYQRWGRRLLEDIPLGTYLLIRAAFYNGIRYAFIKKWTGLND